VEEGTSKEPSLLDNRKLHDTIQSLVTWTEKHQCEIAPARASYDARVAA
jgi:hypothetical protein